MLILPAGFDFCMRNIKLILSYDGTGFSGWQVQPDVPTIQGTLASAIGRITGEKVLPQGSGRTDAGVHAIAQVATFQTESRVPAPNVLVALNDILPPAIRVLEATEVSAEFHPRKSAKAKTYRYRIYREAICPPFLAPYVGHYPYPLDENAMQEAAPLIEGEHDFTSFAAVNAEKGVNHEEHPSTSPRAGFGARSNIRTIFSSHWQRWGEEYVYEVQGNGFLHHMVRNLVGTFLLVGKRTLKPQEVTTILEAKNRSVAGATAPASGLYLVSVEYSELEKPRPVKHGN
jgi:tRNA pseudouridine38-40 synthase